MRRKAKGGRTGKEGGERKRRGRREEEAAITKAALSRNRAGSPASCEEQCVCGGGG